MGRYTLKFSSCSSCTWDSARKAAQAQGGDLPTIKAIRKYVKKNGGYALYPGTDKWLPCHGKNGKDWVQAGDKHHKPGKSHVEDIGNYPSWGDQSNSYPFTTVLVVSKPNLEFAQQSSSLTWDAAKQAALAKGQDLPYAKRLKKIFKKRGALYPGADIWAACIGDDGGKDWVQIGDKHHTPGKSHTKEVGGYPGWGDQQNNYGFNKILVTYTDNIKVARGSAHYTWSDAAVAALAKGGRLVTTKEAKKWLAKRGAVYPGEDIWAATSGKNGKDWVQLGNKHHAPGKSHVAELKQYPPWGDNASTKNNYGFNTVLLWN